MKQERIPPRPLPNGTGKYRQFLPLATKPKQSANLADNGTASQQTLSRLVPPHLATVVATEDASLVEPTREDTGARPASARPSGTSSVPATGHRRDHRPWGYFDSLEIGERFQVKCIVVNPGARLSLQKHFHRAEHWVVVRGTAEATIDDKIVRIYENESVYIPIGAIHRLTNPGKIPLKVIEVQSGSYLGEDDIVRFDDDYHRQQSPVQTEPHTAIDA